MYPIVRALSALLLCLAAFGAQASLWYGDAQGLHRVATGSNTTDLHAATQEAAAIAIDPTDGSVWSVSRTRVSKFTKNGVLVFSRTLASYANNIGDGRSVAVNPNEASVWIGGERRVLHLARDGTLMSVLQGGSTDLKIAPDDSLWVLDTDRDELRHYNYDGSYITQANLSGASRRTRFLAIDAANEFLWIGGDHALIKRSTNSPALIARTVETSHEVNAISLDPERDELWVLGDNSFHGYRANGTRFLSENLGNDGVNDPETLVFDFDTQALWIGHRRGVSRFTRAGNRVATLPAGETGTIAVSRQALYFVPGIIPASLFGATVKENRPVIAFLYNATCSGNNCPFPPAFYATHSIIADLDGVNISAQFVFDAATGETRYQPPAPLPDGFHMATARAVDADGRVSEPAQLWFTVDTTGPSLVALSPPSGAQVTTPTITVSGSFDSSAVAVAITGGSTQAGNAFSYTVPLQLGANTFTLSASDELGNTTAIALTYTLNPPNAPPTVTLLSPVDGSVVWGGATLRATIADADGTIQRIEFLLDGATVFNFPYTGPDLYIPFAGFVGQHTYAVRVRDNNGAWATSATVSVTVLEVGIDIQSPTQGATVTAGNVPVTGVFKGPPNTSITVNGLAATLVFDGNGGGTYSAVVPLAVGAGQIAAELASPEFTFTAGRSVNVTVVP